VQFDFETMLAPERYKLLLATVLPRPIAWVTTRDARGAVNAAPFSFFNVFGNDPATVGIGIGSKGPAEPKDTRANIRETEHLRRQPRAILAGAANAGHLDRVSERG
jgi:flavin reductase (DIM6/NTAB) family NADH-FMN oxidoreductase RutF